jgi:glycine dehydrogenase
MTTLHELEAHDAFIPRHIGPNDAEIADMLAVVGAKSLDGLVDAIVPAPIKLKAPLALPGPVTEEEAVAKIRAIAAQNKVLRSFIGRYYGTHTPAVIAQHPRNPAWYAYTVPGGDLPQARADQFPDDGRRSHRHGDRRTSLLDRPLPLRRR